MSVNLNSFQVPLFLLTLKMLKQVQHDGFNLFRADSFMVSPISFQLLNSLVCSNQNRVPNR
jgi:hypothetical protein